MSRWAALLIAIVGGAILGYLILLSIAGVLLGIAWLYLFGDDPWPAWTDYVFGTAIVVGGFACWFFCSRMIWRLLTTKR